MRKWLLIMGVMMAWTVTGAKAAEPTIAHQALTLEKEWLNVSRSLEVEDFKGRIVLVDFWTFCCINCMHVIPDLHYLEQKFGDKLTVIGVHSAKFMNEKDSENIRSAVLRYDIHHPVVNDKDFRIWQKFGVKAWPSLVLLNPEGRVVKSLSGEGHRAELEEAIGELIAKNKGTLKTSPLPIALEKEKAAPTPLSFPGKLAFDPVRKRLFIADSGHNRILIAGLDGKVEAIVGAGEKGSKDGVFADAQFSGPQGMAYSQEDGLLYVADTGNHLIRAIDVRGGSVHTIAGNGKQGQERRASGSPALTTPLASPWDVALYPDAHQLMIAMAGTHQLWRYEIPSRTLSVVAGNGRESIDDGAYPANSLSQPSGLAVEGGKLYFVDSETSSLRVLENGSVTTLIGSGLFDFGFADGVRGTAKLQHPIGLDAVGGRVLIADSYNHSIRSYNESTGELSTLAGNGMRGEFSEPNDVIAVEGAYYIADTNNNRIRVLEKGVVRDFELQLPVMDAGTRKVGYIAADTLPNLHATKAVKLAPSDALPVEFGLKKGWKVNEEAPSYLALFARGQKEAIATLNRDELRQQSPKFPVALQEGAEYALQGTIYYCENRADAVCLIRSVSQEVQVVPGGDTSFTVDLK